MDYIDFYSSSKNKVLRDTFLLLSFTLLPTILGAWFGMFINLSLVFLAYPVMSCIGSILLLSVLLLLIHANADDDLGILFLLIFTAGVGFVLSAALETILSTKNGFLVVIQSIIGTILVTISCSIYAMTTKRDFSSIGGLLFGILLSVVLLSILNLFLKLTILHLILSFVGFILFSVYLVYNVQQVVNGGETNYIRATVSLYLDIANIFVNLLSIFNFLDFLDFND